MSTSREQLKEVAAQIDAVAYASVPEFLEALYESAKKKIPRYSYRKLAEDLGFGATNIVHLFVRKKRPITGKTLQKICNALESEERQRSYLNAMVDIERVSTPEKRGQALDQLIELKQKYAPSKIDRRHIEYASKWYHPVIREMVSLPSFQSDPKWIAQQIHPKVSVAQVRESLALLVKIGFLTLDDDGEYYQVDEQVDTGPKMKQLYAVSYHREAIPLGIDALVTVPGKQRSVSSMTLSVSERQFKLIKEKIAAFQAELFAIENDREDAPPDRIVQVNMQLFPTTKVKLETK